MTEPSFLAAPVLAVLLFHGRTVTTLCRKRDENQRLDPTQAPAPTPDRFATEFGWNFSANILVRHGCNSPQLGERSLEINATLWTS